MKKVVNWIKNIFYSKNNITCFDDEWANKTVAQRIEELEERILKLEDENVSMTNEFYRLENSLDARIDMIVLENHVTKNLD